LQWVKDGKLSEEDLLAGLDSFLIRDYDRAVFDLSPKQKPFPVAAPAPASSQEAQSKRRAVTKTPQSPLPSPSPLPTPAVKVSRLPVAQRSEDELLREFNL
jgi:hypothetical protein